MADKPILRVATNKAPNLLNGELVSGAAKGAIVASVLGMPVVAPVVIAGAGISAFMKKQQDDQSLAKTGAVIEEVKPPTVFNREMLVGVVGAGALATAAPFLTGGLSLAFLATGPVGWALGTVAALAVPVGAGLFGKGRMEKEYREAEVTVRQQAAADQLAIARGRSAGNVVSMGKSAPNYTNSAPLSMIEAGRNSAPMQGGFVEKALAERQQQQLAGAGVPS